MATATYLKRRDELEAYFDRTASAAWAKLTSDAPVSGIRATVRAGRDAMRETLLNWLPDDMSGCRVLDAGCGAGQLSVAVAERGADVVAIDLSRTLVDLAAERSREMPLRGSIDFRVGDMFSPELGQFDHVVAMDSVIHYNRADLVTGIEKLAALSQQSVLFTFAPRTPALAVMHTVGKVFPRSDRSPAIQPHPEAPLRACLETAPGLADCQIGRSQRIGTGFYISHALEVTK